MFAVKKMITAAVLACAAMSAQAVPTLTFSTPAVTVGSSVDVDVNIADIADLYSYQFSVGFNANLLQVTSITGGSFLGATGAADQFVLDVNNVTGAITWAIGSLSGPMAGVNGSGGLITIHFDTLAAGTSLLNFSDVLFLDSSPDGEGDIAVTAVDSALTILPVVVVPPGTDVPEPATLLLLGVGGAAFMMRRNGAKAIQQAA